jgi:acyl-coenzyme A thioesterase PaaI-like protein
MQRRAGDPTWLAAIRDGAEKYQPGAGLCGACSGTGQCHLGMVLESTDRGVRGTATASEGWRGGAGAVHGGWTAAVLDEALGHTTLSRGYTSVTKTLTIDYISPGPVGVPLEIEGWVEEMLPDGQWLLAGELRFGDQVLARAHGVWISRDLTRHAGKHRTWLNSHGFEV